MVAIIYAINSTRSVHQSSSGPPTARNRGDPRATCPHHHLGTRVADEAPIPTLTRLKSGLTLGEVFFLPEGYRRRRGPAVGRATFSLHHSPGTNHP
jgi:hypothetical protein